MRRPEQQLQRMVVQALEAALPRTWIVHHSPNGIRSTQKQGAIMKSLGTKAGFPDITVIGPGGQSYFLELKAADGSLSLSQRTMRSRLTSLEAPYALVKSWEDVCTAAQAWEWPMRGM